MSNSAFAATASSAETASLDAAAFTLMRSPFHVLWCSSSQPPHTVTLTSPQILSRTGSCSTELYLSLAARGLRCCCGAWLSAGLQARCCYAHAYQKHIGARWKGSLAAAWLTAFLTLSSQRWTGLWLQLNTYGELFVLICVEILLQRLQVWHVVCLCLPLQVENPEMSSYFHLASSCWPAQVASTAPRATLLALVSPVPALHF
jgi:hypothetical protein